MNFPLVLFDADDTLFDFGRSERHSFFTILADHKIDADETVFSNYKSISSGLWKQFERGEISLQMLRVARFQKLMESHGYSGDATALSEGYLDVLKHQTFLIEGAVELCKAVAARSRIGIVTNGIEYVQKHRLAKSELAPYIEFIVVSEECGFAKPQRGIFDYTLKKAAHTDPAKILMVGDRLDTDVIGAQAIGIKGCWFNPAKVVNETEIKPDFEVHSLNEIIEKC